MKIKSIKITNYKSFKDSGKIELDPMVNIIVGKNNSGKTTFLEAISQNFINNAHVSLRVKPTPHSYVDAKSLVEIEILMLSQEIQEIFNNNTPDKELLIFSHLTNVRSQLKALSQQLEELLQIDIRIDAKIKGDQEVESVKINGFSNSFTSFPAPDNTAHRYRFKYKNDQVDHISMDSKTYSGSDVINTILFEKFKKSVYKFKALRQNIGSCQIKDSNKGLLKPDASNLPAVLLLLSKNPIQYNEYVNYVKHVFSGIEDVRPNIIDGTSNTEIRVWTHSPNSKRDDLAFSLIESGTGISQVLAILYVVTTYDTPKTIIIDEPQSFLHPDAIRKLLRVFKNHPQHQYIIATHSPIIINNLGVNKTFLIQLDDQESKIEFIDSIDNHQMTKLLDEIGSSVSDVLGYEKILWVEGPTEEKAFPAILESIEIELPFKIRTLSVKSTGDFEKKSIRIAIDVYKRLCNGIGLIPPAIGFIFDREGKSDHEIEDLARESGGLVSFLERKLFENYLLDPHSIAVILNNLIQKYYGEAEQKKEVTESSVKTWLDENIWRFEERKNNGVTSKVYKYFDQKEKQMILDWLSEKGEEYEKINFEKIKVGPNAANFYQRFVHGAKLLKDLFADFTDYKIEYSKTRDSVAITHEILKKCPQELEDISNQIANWVNLSPKDA